MVPEPGLPAVPAAPGGMPTSPGDGSGPRQCACSWCGLQDGGALNPSVHHWGMVKDLPMGRSLSPLVGHGWQSPLKAFSQISSWDPSSCLGKGTDRRVRLQWDRHVGSCVLSLPEPFPTLGDGQARGLGFFQGKVSPAASFLCDTGDGRWTESARDMPHCPQQSPCVCGGSLGESPGTLSKDPERSTLLSDLGLAPQATLARECGSWGQPGISRAGERTKERTKRGPSMGHGWKKL